MDVASRTPPERGDDDDPPAQEAKKDLPRRRGERIVEVEREIPFIEREVQPSRT
jgi:hypothetical protein